MVSEVFKLPDETSAIKGEKRLSHGRIKSPFRNKDTGSVLSVTRMSRRHGIWNSKRFFNVSNVSGKNKFHTDKAVNSRRIWDTGPKLL